MSKKQQQKNKQNTQQQHPPCSEIVIVLPNTFYQLSGASKAPAIDLTFLTHYIKALLLKKKTICKTDILNVMFLGKQINVAIHSIVPLKIEDLGEKKIVEDKIQENARGRQRTKKGKKVSESSDQSETEPIKNPQYYSINTNTVVNILEKSQQIKQGKSKINCETSTQFYGDTTIYNELKEAVIHNFRMRDNLFKIKLGPIRGILLGGATGTGKTTYIKRLESDLQVQNINLYSISSTQLLSRVVGGSQEKVQKIFRDLATHDKSCLIIEDMHLLFGEKQVSSNETALITLFNEMSNFNKALLVIGTYNSERELSRTVYQSGHFQKQMILNLPNHKERLNILLEMVKQFAEISEDDVRQFNLRLNGFSIGEIKQILRDAYIKNKQRINKDALFEALKNYRPSQIKELIVEVPEVYWSGIGGYQHVKKQIRKVTQLPLKFPQKFQLLNITPSKGILLYGPPGCSKTMMAKAIATQSKLNFISIKGPELFSKYVGESERAIRNIFRKARAFSPCIIFFDQIDALASQRNQQSDVTNRVLGQLLTEMDGVQGLKQVIIIAATNRPEILDEALTRPGRFDHLIYVSPPDYQARVQIFQICLKKTPIEGDLKHICEEMGKKSDNYTGAQITLICRQAALIALQQNFEEPRVNLVQLLESLSKIRSRLDREKIRKYEQFNAKFHSPKTQQIPNTNPGGQSNNSGFTFGSSNNIFS